MKTILNLVLASLLLAGCSSDGHKSASSAAQETFASPQDALAALKVATHDRNREELRKIFGPAISELDSGDARQDEMDYQRFAAAMERGQTLEGQEDGSIYILIGPDKWEFPAPLVREGDRWRFDTTAGAELVADRRIGTNELDAIRTCRGLVRAQKQYFEMDPDGDTVKAYASRVRSTPGRRDGLYWPDEQGQPASPLGPAVARAVAAGRITADQATSDDQSPQPYRGYYYKVLTSQSAAAPGGAKNYLDAEGKMTGGFAFMAWPANYEHSGVMSFIVGPDGVVYQRDLGAAGASSAAVFDPAGWTAVQEEASPAPRT